MSHLIVFGIGTVFGAVIMYFIKKPDKNSVKPDNNISQMIRKEYENIKNTPVYIEPDKPFSGGGSRVEPPSKSSVE